MDKPFGKASRRTFIRNGTPLPLTSWISPKVKSSNNIKMSNRPPSEALKGGLPMSVMQLRREKRLKYETDCDESG